jgi:hypothetical protein
MFGDQIGDAFGAGGLGLQGAGSSPSDGGARRTTAPKLREGSVTVNGALPPEVVRRIVRQNFGRFRLCYENALKKNPKLAGTVTTRFVIVKDGSVASVSDAGSTLADTNAVACIVRSFGALSFPQPENGVVVVVTYPITLSPS